MSKRQDRPQKDKEKKPRVEPNNKAPISKEQLRAKIKEQFDRAFGNPDK